MILFAVLTSICSVSQSAFTKIASGKGTTASPMLFNTWKVGASFAFFLLISLYNLQLHIPTVVFGTAYGFSLFLSTHFGYQALASGSMALTSLIVSYSVIIPFFFGILFLNESVGYIQIFGIILLLISIYMLNRRADNVTTKKHWLLYVIITFFCNGISSILQKLHQTAYPSSYCREFMVCSLFIGFLLFTVIAKIKKEKKNEETAKYAIASGILMGLANYLTLVLSAKVNATVLFPLISVFSMIINIIVSRLYFKDKFSIIQLAGIGVGVISVLMIK